MSVQMIALFVRAQRNAICVMFVYTLGIFRCLQHVVCLMSQNNYICDQRLSGVDITYFERERERKTKNQIKEKKTTQTDIFDLQGISTGLVLTLDSYVHQLCINESKVYKQIVLQCWTLQI